MELYLDNNINSFVDDKFNNEFIINEYKEEFYYNRRHFSLDYPYIMFKKD